MTALTSEASGLVQAAKKKPSPCTMMSRLDWNSSTNSGQQFFTMETTKTDYTTSSTRQPMESLRTFAKTLTAKFASILKLLDVRRFFRTTQKKEFSRLEDYELYTDILVGYERSRNTQSITDWKKEQYLWDTSIAYNKLTPEDIEVLLVFREDAYVRSVRCVMPKTDWQHLSGVLDGYMGSYKVRTGRSGKPIESETSSSSATKQNETEDDFVSKRTDGYEGSLQEGIGRIRTSGVLFFQRDIQQIQNEPQGMPKKTQRLSGKRKTRCRMGKKKGKPSRNP